MAERHKLYEYEYKSGKIILKNKKCPRCGSVMALHRTPTTRWHCGKCNYVEFITQRR